MPSTRSRRPTHLAAAFAPAVVLLLAACTSGPATPSPDGGQAPPSETVPEVVINADLDLPPLLPTFDQVDWAGADIEASDPAQAEVVTAHGSPSDGFTTMLCSDPSLPYMPTPVAASKRVYRDFNYGNAVATATVIKLASAEEAALVIGRYVELLNYCTQNGGGDYDLLIDDAQQIYGKQRHDSTGSEFRWSAIGPYVIAFGNDNRVSADVASAVINEVRDRIRAG